MPAVPLSAIRKQIADRQPQPVYLLVGDDDALMASVTAEISSLVDDELRAFNLERLYATDKGVTPTTIVEAARTLPMLGDRRLVVVLRAEKILKPKRRGKAAGEDESGGVDDEPPSDLDALEAYVKQPEPGTTLVLVAADADRQRKVFKALLKHATILECWGLRMEGDLPAAQRAAEHIVRDAVAEAGQQIDAGALKLIAGRAGMDIAQLRGDLDRLLLYMAGKPRITLQDAQEIVSGETSQDDWAVTNAIARRNAAEALRELNLALDAGGISYKILGQLAWFVREKLAGDPRRIGPAVDALFRTDVELKSSGGDPRVLLERLVVELCR